MLNIRLVHVHVHISAASVFNVREKNGGGGGLKGGCSNWEQQLPEVCHADRAWGSWGWMLVLTPVLTATPVSLPLQTFHLSLLVLLGRGVGEIVLQSSLTESFFFLFPFYPTLKKIVCMSSIVKLTLSILLIVFFCMCVHVYVGWFFFSSPFYMGNDRQRCS